MIQIIRAILGFVLVLFVVGSGDNKGTNIKINLEKI